MGASDPAITHLLQSWRCGNAAAEQELMGLVYDRLRKLAGSHLRNEGPGHTLVATALVHEAYLKVAGAEIDWQDRAHFFAVASTAMRRVLVDHAKGHRRQRRGGGAIQTELNERMLLVEAPDPAILEIDESLERLAKRDPRKVQAVELVFFGGLTYTEAGQMMGISEATVKRELRMARAWIRHDLKSNTATDL